MTLTSTLNKQEIISAADECVLCGLCLPHCPTYSIAKTESESPRGRITLVRALYEDQLEASETIHSHLDHCLTCMKCEQVCPANVDYEKIIDAGREASRTQVGLFQRIQQTILLFSLSNTNARKVTRGLIAVLRASRLQPLFKNKRIFGLIPEAVETLLDSSNVTGNEIKHNSSVMLVNSCAGDLVNDPIYDAAKRVLSKLGCEIIENHQTQCCGALHQHNGNSEIAQKLRKTFTNLYESYRPDYVISLATGCGAQIKRYPKFDDSSIAHELANKLMDINEFVLQQIKNSDFEFKPLAKTIYLHKPCSQQQVTNDESAVEKLLSLIPKINLVEFEDKLACCGAGGINTVTHHTLADQLIEDKVHELSSASASYLVSSNIGCALHFQAQLKSENIPVQVCHPLTLLAEQML